MLAVLIQAWMTYPILGIAALIVLFCWIRDFSRRYFSF